MATNVELDEKMIKEAMILGGHASKRAAIEHALRDYVRHWKQSQITQVIRTSA
jgi:Arc/MetJ family transcription regulator